VSNQDAMTDDQEQDVLLQSNSLRQHRILTQDHVYVICSRRI
jgi:hypothetical protein